MKTRTKLGGIVAATVVTASLITVIFAGAASAWHGIISSTRECVNHDTVATFDLKEPGESWNSDHSNMVILESNSALFKVGTQVPFGVTYEPDSIIITTPVTVTLKLGWVGSTEVNVATTTATPLSGCETTTTTTEPTTTTTEATTTTTAEVTTTTAAPTTTTTAEPTTTTTAEQTTTTTEQQTTTTTAPATTTTTAPATTTTTAAVTTTTVCTDSTTLPPSTDTAVILCNPATPATPVTGTPAFTG